MSEASGWNGSKRWWVFSRLKVPSPVVEREISLENCDKINHTHSSSLAAMRFYYKAIGRYPKGFYDYVDSLCDIGLEKMDRRLRRVVDPEYVSFVASKPTAVSQGLFLSDVKLSNNENPPF